MNHRNPSDICLISADNFYPQISNRFYTDNQFKFCLSSDDGNNYSSESNRIKTDYQFKFRLNSDDKKSMLQHVKDLMSSGVYFLLTMQSYNDKKAKPRKKADPKFLLSFTQIHRQLNP